MGTRPARLRVTRRPRLSPDPRPPRQPILNVPPAVAAVLGALLAVHLLGQVLPDEAGAWMFDHLAFVPGRLTALVDPAAVGDRVALLPSSDAQGLDRRGIAEFFLSGGARVWTPVTYALLHGGWTHLGVNAVWLLAFGTPVARRFGAARFLLFLGAGALAGALTHEVLFPFSFDPLVGVSAAVSACMGGALRFAFRPVGEPRVPGSPPALPLSRLAGDRRVTGFAVAWFVTNLVTGVGPVADALAGGPVAWQAHVGGFLLGLLGFALFDPVGAHPPAAPPPAEGASEAA